MSILPWLLNDPFLELYRPRYFDLDPWDISRELRLSRLAEYVGKSFQEAESKVLVDKGKYQVSVDVQQFAPNEISVKTSGDGSIVVEGKHEERPDEHGYISRHFVRRYVLPKEHDINQVVSNLSSNGVLTITAPKISKDGVDHKTIAIQQTGHSSNVESRMY